MTDVFFLEFYSCCEWFLVPACFSFSFGGFLSLGEGEGEGRWRLRKYE